MYKHNSLKNGVEKIYKVEGLVTKVGGLGNLGILGICVGYNITSKLLEYEQIEIILLWHLLLEKGVETVKVLSFANKVSGQCPQPPSPPVSTPVSFLVHKAEIVLVNKKNSL